MRWLAREQAVGELLRLEMRIARDVLEPFHAVARRALQLEHLEIAFRPVALEPGADIAGAPATCDTSDIASSMASFVPEPMAKCAVCAASPISTTFP